ncbi:MAG: hypothetical protein ACI865_000925 [Flavobacteriaceae bacterium]|jgi:hypothetical protein
MKTPTLVWFVLLIASVGLGQELKLTSFPTFHSPLDNFQSPTSQMKLPRPINVDAFEMSDLITWKQFKLFLEDTRKIKGDRIANRYTPKLNSKHIQGVLNTVEFDDMPAVGVSWTAAREFARWKTLKDNKHSIEFTYDLPRRSDWLSALYQLESKKKKHDLNKNYADWTLATKDESMYNFGTTTNAQVDYHYDALPDDPPSMKRKIAIGASFKFKFPYLGDYTQSYYQDSSYSHIGFRLVKRACQFREIDCYDDWLSELFTPYLDYNYLSYGKTAILDDLFINYSLNHNRLSGKYKSTYSNDQTKAEGYFYRNQRVGSWIVWDSLGNKLLERIYTNSQHYLQVYPELDDPQAEALRAKRTRPVVRDENNNLTYHFIEERVVIWSQRLWTQITEEDNGILFKDDRLIDLLSLSAHENRITIYSPATDEFRDTLSFEEFSSNRSGPVVAYAIKEDFFMDIERGTADTRPIGICPMAQKISDGDTTLQPMGWFYFPEIREILSESYIASRCIADRSTTRQYLINKKQNETSKNLDDLFYLRDYVWHATHEASIHGKRPFESNESGWDFRLQQIEREHDFWIYSNTPQ